MHTEIGCENLLANVQIGKLRAQLNVYNVTFQSDPQFSWKLLNYYITLALLSMAGVPIKASLMNGNLIGMKSIDEGKHD